MNPKDIRNTLPLLDCKFIVVRNFVNFNGDYVSEQYAECLNNNKTQGCVSIYIVKDPISFEWETNCVNCKYYESSAQLNLFYL